MVSGSSEYVVDQERVGVDLNELLVCLPHQILERPDYVHGNDYYKLGFDEECISRLPRQYPFLLNPFNRQKVRFSPDAAVRVQAVFTILQRLLGVVDCEPDLILAHLNSLLTEINTAYFADDEGRSDDDRLSKFIRFKLFVENSLTDQPSVGDMAKELAISTDSLYQIVKQYSVLSPKEFFIGRLMLEARRRMWNKEKSSVKELAFELGFNDPDYFSRLFKKFTGKTVGDFLQDLS